ncbi:SDR family NAD(P)-dependent oxidoreductase [Sediminitomix flava]|uniref:Short-subunit dehydrogenase n=1 Tax=Sediminitomix flava TaxID=379075 RepID=A0A315ZF36_SEDFL|nr:SDR family NAD(P)-dependent oxidoreductase [Sediminitomix flava]PWJ43942.1 hypothetical protein BC781_101292 [Sediminitomix flava]
MTKLKDKTILITGACAGIGKALLIQGLIQKAKSIIYLDKDLTQVHRLYHEFQPTHCELRGEVVDISNPNEVKEIAQQLAEEDIHIDILFNNAGVMIGKYFHEMQTEEIDLLMDVNAKGSMYVASALLPRMIERKQGHIVNITSIAGLVSCPQMSVYCASKWASTGWSESLRLEMEQLKTNIKVTTVQPGHVNTTMFTGFKSNFLTPTLTAEEVAKQIVKGVGKNKIFVRMPFMNRLSPFIKGILPVRWFDLLIGRGLGIYDSMANFEGNNPLKSKEEKVTN